MIGINPYSIEYRVIRISSLIIIGFILYYNSYQSFITASLLAVSIDKISYLHDLKSPISTVEFSSREKWVYLSKVNDISNFLNTLEDHDYIATIEFVPGRSNYNSEAPQMILSKPFLINKFSSSTTITKFIIERLDNMIEYYQLNEDFYLIMIILIYYIWHLKILLYY